MAQTKAKVPRVPRDPCKLTTAIMQITRLKAATSHAYHKTPLPLWITIINNIFYYMPL